MVEETTANETAQAANQTQQSAQAATSTAQAATEQQSQNTQQIDIEALQRELAEARKEAAKYRNAAKEQAATAQKAEEARLLEQGEFKTLAEKHEARVKELEPQVESLATWRDRAAKVLSDLGKSASKDWPKEVADLLPQGENIDPLELLEAVEKYRPLVDKLKAANPAGARPNQPRPQGGQALTPLVSATKRF